LVLISILFAKFVAILYSFHDMSANIYYSRQQYWAK